MSDHPRRLPPSLPLITSRRGRTLPLKIPLTTSRIPVKSTGRCRSLPDPSVAAGAATWQSLAVSVQSRKVGELSDEPGPPWTAAAQPAVQSAALAESVVDQYENDGERTPTSYPLKVL